MELQVFIKTITAYNIYVDAGYDPEFEKEAFDLKVEKAPYYATLRKPAVHHTMGGLKMHAGNRLVGNSLTDIFTFERIAAETAIAEKC